MVGRMKYRSSYGQNLLQHRAKWPTAPPWPLNWDSTPRPRASPPRHQVSDEESEPHALLGMKIAERCGEPDVLNAIEPTDEIEMTTLLAHRSSLRCHFRRSSWRPPRNVEAYIQRLRDLENLALEFQVTKYSPSSGRTARHGRKRSSVGRSGRSAVIDLRNAS